MILIGLPVFKRDWLLPLFFSKIENQTWPLDDLGFVFEIAPDDEATTNALHDFHEAHPEIQRFIIDVNSQVHHQTHPEMGRSWNVQKYTNMSIMRNRLLEIVRVVNPERYFSLDSDVLLENPKTIQILYELTKVLDVVSPVLYMTPDNMFYPSVMTWIPGTERAYRRLDYPVGQLFESDVVMAAKMMSQKAYKTATYFPHQQGEDLGFCLNMQKAGIKLYCASYLHCTHIMTKAMLGEYEKLGYDPRLLKGFS